MHFTAPLKNSVSVLSAELLIPDRANVFYALNNSVDLNFVLRHRAEQQSLTDKKKGKTKKKLSL
jgi:hypothetical protein